MARQLFPPLLGTLANQVTVSAEVEAKYVVIIDTILASSDLNTISEKRIRKGLQQAVDYDITPQKVVASVCTDSI